jgi:hypothetical protein
MYLSKENRKRLWRNRLKVFVGILMILIGIVYLFRQKLERGLIALAIYHEHIFTVPRAITAKSWWPRTVEEYQFYWDVAGLRVAREKRLKQFNPALKPVVKEINQKQSTGQAMGYSMHIYREIRWLLNFTNDTAATRSRINDLRESLLHPEEQQLASEQQASDGSWGAGIHAWYLRFYYSMDELEDSTHPTYPLSFLDRINSPGKLKEQLNADLYNNFIKTGTFNREELDETFSAIARLLNKTKQKIAYTFYPQLDSALKDYVNLWQNPVTGCWGQWMIDRHGYVWKMDDVGITFHVISDLHGNVAHKDLIAKRLLELDNINFPAGIRLDEHYENHLNWDAVKIFRYAWPFLDSATRKKVRDEISLMLHWCLENSYQPDGSFKISDLDDTMGDAYRYGVAFLGETGYFQKGKRFWTNEDFPEAQSVHDHIKAKILSIGLNAPGFRDAYETLEGNNF